MAKKSPAWFTLMFSERPLTIAVAVCSLKAVASRTLAVEAPGSVNAAKHTGGYSCRQQALIHIWEDGEYTLFIDVNDIKRHKCINGRSHTAIHTPVQEVWS